MKGKTNAYNISAQIIPTESVTVNVLGITEDFEITISKQSLINTKYTHLEYIEATGTQYIDTGFKPNQDTRVLMETECLIDGNNYFLFGARTNNSNNNTAALTYGFNAYQTKYRTHYYNGWSDYATTISFTDKFVLDKNKNVTTIGNSNVITRTYTSFLCKYNMYLFAVNTAGTAETFGSTKLYSCKIYDNGTLIRNYIPALNENGIPGLYDSVNNTFLVSAGTTDFIAGPTVTYTKVEYIESTGTQYIDTTINPNLNTTMYLDVAFLSSVGTNVAGVRNTSSDTTNRFGIISFSSTSKLGAFFRDSSIWAINYDTLRHIYELSKSGLIVDNVSYGSSNNNTFTCTYPITLGAWNNGNGGISYNNSIIYACKIYDNGTLIRDFIPVLRSDGITGLYDILNEAFYKSCGTSNFVSGNIIGEIIAVQTTTTATYKIPYDTLYLVSASTITGYKTPLQQIFVSSQPNRSVSMLYEKLHMGVYIQDVSGALYTEDEWDELKTANGIAVITDNCRFVMALADARTTYCQWGNYGTLVSGITTTTDENTAKTDYDGEALTTTLLNVLGDTDEVNACPPAHYCRSYTFPNGKKGYLGAAGEWQAALDNKASVESALSKCGGASMNGYYWTSTQYDSIVSWYMYWSNEYLHRDAKSDYDYVRAFAAI